MLHLIFISSWMHVSIYLFIASLYIHDMNNALYINQMADQEQSLKASFWKINHLHGVLSVNQLCLSPNRITAECSMLRDEPQL